MSAPTITALNPSTGSASGGTAVVITGTGFTGATAVKFGTVNAISFVVYSSTLIACTAPLQASGAVNVIVTNADGTSTSTATYTYTGSTIALVPMAEVENFIGAGKYEAVQLQRWLNGLSAFIRRRIGRPIETAVIAEVLDGNGETVLRVSEIPLVAVAAIVVDDVNVTADVLWYEDGDLYLDSGFTAGHQNVELTYSAGHGATVPDDLQLAVCLILTQAAQSSQLHQVRSGEYDIIFDTDKWPKNAREIVDSYRRKL